MTGSQSPPPHSLPMSFSPRGRACTPLITRCYICYDVIQEFDRSSRRDDTRAELKARALATVGRPFKSMIKSERLGEEGGETRKMSHASDTFDARIISSQRSAAPRSRRRSKFLVSVLPDDGRVAVRKGRAQTRVVRAAGRDSSFENDRNFSSPEFSSWVTRWQCVAGAFRFLYSWRAILLQGRRVQHHSARMRFHPASFRVSLEGFYLNHARRSRDDLSSIFLLLGSLADRDDYSFGSLADQAAHAESRSSRRHLRQLRIADSYPWTLTRNRVPLLVTKQKIFGLGLAELSCSVIIEVSRIRILTRFKSLSGLTLEIRRAEQFERAASRSRVQSWGGHIRPAGNAWKWHRVIIATRRLTLHGLGSSNIVQRIDIDSAFRNVPKFVHIRACYLIATSRRVLPAGIFIRKYRLVALVITKPLAFRRLCSYAHRRCGASRIFRHYPLRCVRK